MMNADLMHQFLHNAHVFASTVQDIMGEKYLRETVDREISLPQYELLRLIERNGSHQVREIAGFMATPYHHPAFGDSVLPAEGYWKGVESLPRERDRSHRRRRAGRIPTSTRGEPRVLRVRARPGRLLQDLVAALTKVLDQVLS